MFSILFSTLPRRVPTLLALIMVAAAVVEAQQASFPANRFPYYFFDSTFVIGGYSVSRTWLLQPVRDELHFRMIGGYGGPTMLDSASITRALPGDSTPKIQRTLFDFNDSAQLGLRFMYTPKLTGALAKSATNVESYAAYNSAVVQVSDFQHPAPGQADTTLWSKDFVQGWSVTSTLDTNGVRQPIADKPRFTYRAFLESVSGLYNAVEDLHHGRPCDDNEPTLSGIYTEMGSVQPGFVDSSGYYRAAFTVRIDSTLPTDLDAPLLTVTLYRRDYFDQLVDGHPLCTIYAPFRTFQITRRVLQDSMRLAGGSYIEVGTFFPSVWKTVGDTAYHVSRFINGGPLPEGDGCATCEDCDSMLTARKTLASTDLRYLPSGAFKAASAAERSDVIYRVVSSDSVPLTLLRGSISTHVYHTLNTSTTFDTLIHREIDAVYDDPIVDSAFHAFGILDEPIFEHQRSFGLVSRKVQRRMNANRSTERRNVFTEVYGAFDGLRVFSNDMDTLGHKTMQTIIYDSYIISANEPIAMFYANPDRMSTQASRTVYRLSAPDTDTTRDRYLYGNSMKDYADFTTFFQGHIGTSGERGAAVHSSASGPWLSKLARSVDVAQFRYLKRDSTKTPVYLLVDVHGLIPFSRTESPAAYYPRFEKRIPTPEEIRLQVWLGLNCGIGGVMFSEMTYSGHAIGPLRLDSAHRDAPHAGEYDRPQFYKDTNAVLDTTWVGFESRYKAIKEVTRSVHYIDSVIGWRNLRYEQEQISLHDPTMSLSGFPMVARAVTERAVDSTPTFRPHDTVSRDLPNETYLELTHYWPRSGDVVGTRASARYLLVTNRRLYPIDFQQYSNATRLLMDSVTSNDTSTAARHRLKGLGNIDVRRPVLWLRNSTPVLGDSLLVEKIDTGNWKRTISVRDSIELDWLRPGDGALYRVTPIGDGISLEGTAYNNAVHSENPSRPGATKDRIVVYERDSIVYLRTLDSLGRWGREFRISDATDSVDAVPALPWWQRPAANFHPAVATVRDDSGTSCMIVWERFVKPATVTVEARLLRYLPRADVDTLPPGVRFRIASAHPLLPPSTAHDSDGGTAHAPAVIGIDHGYVVAYPSTGSGAGMSVTLVRDFVRTSTSVDPKDTLTTHHIRWPNTADPVISDSAYFPTLAHRRHWGEFLQGSGHWQCIVGADETPPANGAHSGLIVHLAYQQGRLDTMSSQFIMYNMIAVNIASPGVKPIMWVSPTEHASANLVACGFLHPSIAADSISVGVAFQSNEWYRRRPILRFRQSDSSTRSYPSWTTLTYQWDNGPGKKEWPSLTMFPAVSRSELLSAVGGPTRKGAVVWFRTDAPNTIATQEVYRFGARSVAQLPNGVFPTMTLAAKQSTQYYEATSIFYRADTSYRDTIGRRPVSTHGVYYPAHLENGPLTPAAYLRTSAVSTRSVLMGQSEIRAIDVMSVAFCDRKKDIIIKIGTDDDDEEFDAGVSQPGPPPSFFLPAIDQEDAVESLADAERITRSGVFETGATPTLIKRHVSRSNDAVAWLNTQPYDSSLMSFADVRVLTELVRVSDSAVVWRDDTISVREMTVDTLAEEVELPTHLLSPGTGVFARIRMVPTAALDFMLSGGFSWEPDTGAFASKVARWSPRSPPSSIKTDAAIAMFVVPNPAHESATVMLETQQPTEIVVTLVDALGRVVRRYPALNASRSGQYGLPISLEGVAYGLYVLRAEAADGPSTSTTLVVAP